MGMDIPVDMDLKSMDLENFNDIRTFEYIQNIILSNNSCSRHESGYIKMKKIMSVFAVTAMVCGLMACGNSKAPANEQIESEPIETEEVADSCLVDTSVVETRGESDSEGFGRCGESGCYCKGFKGRGDTCQNCGHAYRKHY